MTSQNSIKLAFFGNGEISSKTLEGLLEGGYRPEIIITQPDKRSGRGMEMKEAEIITIANKYNIPYSKIEKLDNNTINILNEYKIELSIVVAYGKILPQDIIDHPKYGTINIHYSLLPKYRGASPLESSLLNGDTKTGVSIQKMIFKLDSGPILSEQETEINMSDTKDSLKEKLIKIGVKNLSNLIPKILDGSVSKKEQDENKASYCKKIKKEDGLLDIINSSPKENWYKYRAYLGWPNTFFFVNKKNKNIRVKITKAKYENDSFIIERVIPEGRKEISYSDFIRN